ncbi:MAG: hypothetical protein ACK5TR_08445 [Alphaproteobacteria bacterium]
MKILMTSCALALSLCLISTPNFASFYEKEEGGVPSHGRLMRHEAKNMSELRHHLSGVCSEDVVGFDCDNTLVKAFLVDHPHLYDYEMMREFKESLWRDAGEAAKLKGLVSEESDSTKFADYCWRVIKQKKSQMAFALVDTDLPVLAQELQQQADTFICTGIPPERKKLEALQAFGLDFSEKYSFSHRAYFLFVEDYRGKMPGWLYAKEKAQSLGSFVLASNDERALTEKRPLQTLYYIDNHLETLNDIARDFNHDITGVKLVLIHWRAHALSLHALHERGEFIPPLLEDLQRLLAPPIPMLTPSALSNASISPNLSLQFSYSNLSHGGHRVDPLEKRRHVLDEEGDQQEMIPTCGPSLSDLRASLGTFGLTLDGDEVRLDGEEKSRDNDLSPSRALPLADPSLIPSATPPAEKNRAALRCSSEALDTSGDQGRGFLKSSQTGLVGSGEFHS